jgi:hypothetical protein
MQQYYEDTCFVIDLPTAATYCDHEYVAVI